jgi:hypothetical protein
MNMDGTTGFPAIKTYGMHFENPEHTCLTENNNTMLRYPIHRGSIMAFEKCNFCSGDKCTAADLEPCDFQGDNFKECLRYRLHFIRPQFMQLR